METLIALLLLLITYGSLFAIWLMIRREVDISKKIKGNIARNLIFIGAFFTLVLILVLVLE